MLLKCTLLESPLKSYIFECLSRNLKMFEKLWKIQKVPKNDKIRGSEVKYSENKGFYEKILSR